MRDNYFLQDSGITLQENVGLRAEIFWSIKRLRTTDRFLEYFQRPITQKTTLNIFRKQIFVSRCSTEPSSAIAKQPKNRIPTSTIVDFRISLYEVWDPSGFRRRLKNCTQLFSFMQSTFFGQSSEPPEAGTCDCASHAYRKYSVNRMQTLTTSFGVERSSWPMAIGCSCCAERFELKSDGSRPMWSLRKRKKYCKVGTQPCRGVWLKRIVWCRHLALKRP